MAPPQLDAIRGVNYADPTCLYRQDVGPPLLGMPPSDATRMNKIAGKGFNTLRIRLYWESYEHNKAKFLKAISSLLSAAATAGLYIIWDCLGQYRVNYALDLLETGRTAGGGFPKSMTVNAGYTTKQQFWTAFWNNASISETPMWTLYNNYVTDIVNQADASPATLGYDILNEPATYSADQYAKIGLFHTFAASTIRALSSKTIFFDKAVNVPSWSGGKFFDYANDPLTKPTGVSNCVFTIHPYDAYSVQSLQQYKPIQHAMQMPMLCTEFGSQISKLTAPQVLAYIRALKNMNLGWLIWSWDPYDPLNNLQDYVSPGVYADNQLLTDLVAAMGNA